VRIGFSKWLKRQHRRKDAIGDLSRDIRNDPSWPKQVRKYAYFVGYVENSGLPEGALAALYSAWCEWSEKFYGQVRLDETG